MAKKCEQCSETYRGFGSACGPCRRKPVVPGSTVAGGITPRDCCIACSKRVYAMEHLSIEGTTFHRDCFRCTTCRRKLLTIFEKSELGFFCPTHFEQIAKVTGGYMTGTGPTRNALTASVVDSMVSRMCPGIAPTCKEGASDSDCNELLGCEDCRDTELESVLTKAAVLNELRAVGERVLGKFDETAGTTRAGKVEPAGEPNLNSGDVDSDVRPSLLAANSLEETVLVAPVPFITSFGAYYTEHLLHGVLPDRKVLGAVAASCVDNRGDLLDTATAPSSPMADDAEAAPVRVLEALKTVDLPSTWEQEDGLSELDRTQEVGDVEDFQNKFGILLEQTQSENGDDEQGA